MIKFLTWLFYWTRTDRVATRLNVGRVGFERQPSRDYQEYREAETIVRLHAQAVKDEFL